MKNNQSYSISLFSLSWIIFPHTPLSSVQWSTLVFVYDSLRIELDVEQQRTKPGGMEKSSSSNWWLCYGERRKYGACFSIGEGRVKLWREMSVVQHRMSSSFCALTIALFSLSSHFHSVSSSRKNYSSKHMSLDLVNHFSARQFETFRGISHLPKNSPYSCDAAVSSHPSNSYDSTVSPWALVLLFAINVLYSMYVRHCTYLTKTTTIHLTTMNIAINIHFS